MTGSPRRRTSPYLDLCGNRLYVFVPAVMSLGFVFWVAALVRDQVHLRRAANLERRATSAALATANITLGRAHEFSQPDHVEARRRSFFLMAVPFLAAAVFVAIGSIGNYLRPDGYLSEIAWVLAIALVSSLAFGVVGVLLVLLGHQWPSPSDRILRVARRTPLVRLHRTGGHLGEPSWGLKSAVLIVSGLAALAAMVVVRRVDFWRELTNRCSTRRPTPGGRCAVTHRRGRFDAVRDRRSRLARSGELALSR